MWSSAPGGGSGPSRRTLRKTVVSFLVGAMSLGVAWAGAGLIPVSGLDVRGEGGRAADLGNQPFQGQGDTDRGPRLDLRSGQLLGGAAKVSLEPNPKKYGGTWERSYEKCATLSANETGVQEGATHVADFRVRWPENPNCIYMGGYGIGPMFPIVKWDKEYGLWARSVAMSDGKDTVILTLIDAVYWEAHYNSMCDGCGFLDLAERLGAELKISPESFIFASTHSHTAPDFIGGWGGVPDWYMEQATASMEAAIKNAVASMRPAVLEAGEEIARGLNGERRDYYRSAEDDGVSWFRLVDAAGPGKAIATVAAYAAHPVTVDHEAGIGDADFPAGSRSGWKRASAA